MEIYATLGFNANAVDLGVPQVKNEPLVTILPTGFRETFEGFMLE
jgi:hypothetical protein